MSETLLDADDPQPVEVLNGGSTYPVTLVCEHAGRAIPGRLGSLGLDQEALDRHIAWDIGAGPLTRCLAENLGATAILQPYSRLVIDCNRPVQVPDAMPAMSDNTPVPGNTRLSDEDRKARIDEIFSPFHRAIDDVLDQGRSPAAVSIHSFTPVMHGQPRPWHIGFVSRQDRATSTLLASVIEARRPDLTIGFDEPYQIGDTSDWFIPRHCERRGLRHNLIEVRNDGLADGRMIGAWCDLLEAAIDSLAETLS